MAGPLTFYCIVQGDKFSERFPVKVDAERTVRELKAEIRKNPLFRPEDDVKLWAARIPIGKDDNERPQISLDKSEKLRGDAPVRNYWKEDKKDGHVHVIVIRSGWLRVRRLEDQQQLNETIQQFKDGLNIQETNNEEVPKTEAIIFPEKRYPNTDLETAFESNQIKHGDKITRVRQKKPERVGWIVKNEKDNKPYAVYTRHYAVVSKSAFVKAILGTESPGSSQYEQFWFGNVRFKALGERAAGERTGERTEERTKG